MHCGRVHFGPARQAALGWARPDHYATISQARMDASHAFEWLWLKGQIRTHAQGMAQCPGGIDLVPPGTKACVCASECRERNSRLGRRIGPDDVGPKLGNGAKRGCFP
jgi:hypothetical protein